MKKNLFILTGCLLLAGGIQAASLTPSEALKRAGISDLPGATGTRTTAPELLRTVTLESGDPALYLFSRQGGEGYLLLSADDVASPLLGYSVSGNAAGESLSPQFEWWLGEYTRQIEYARERNLPAYANSATRSRDEKVAPMVKTRWNQGTPFNDECPTINGRHCPSGCVATAMAQIMKYWNYPEKGTGTGAVTLPETGERETLNFRMQPFDWENMIPSYSGNYTEEEGAAVAYLMKACGYSVDMNYRLGGSGAVTMKAALGLMTNFNYNKNLQYFSRDYCTTTEWTDIIYNELINGRPVLYAGQSTSVGHAFVCDGYDGEGYYHFNWGWGGMSDGYFTLDALNPGSVGTGGGTGGGFNFDQDIVVGIQPEKTEPYRSMIGQTASLRASATGQKVTLRTTATEGLNGWYNFGVHACNLNIGGMIESVDNATMDPVYMVMGSSKLSVPVIQKNDNGGAYVTYSGWSDKISGNIPSGLADGKYKLTVCTQDRETADASWIPVGVVSDAYNYVLFTKAGDSYEFESMEAPKLTLVDAELISELYYGCATRLNVSIANNSAKELTQSFYPLLSSSGRNVMAGEGVTVTLQPGESREISFTTVFALLSGASAPSSRQIFDLLFYQPASGEVYDWSKQVTMNVNLAKQTVEATDFSMPGLEVSEEKVPTGYTQDVYLVHDKFVIPFSCELYNNSGFFGYPVYALVFPGNGGNNVAQLSLTPLLTLAAGESGTVTGLLNFSDGEEGYYFAAPYLLINNYQWKEIEGCDPVWFRITNEDTWVGGITAAVAPALVYDNLRKVISCSSESALNLISVISLDSKPAAVETVRTSATSAEINMTNLPSGVYIVNVIDAEGASTTLKIAR